LVELLDQLRNQPGPFTLTTQDYEKAHDDTEHVYDGAIQASKFALEVAESPVGALKEQVDGMQAAMNDLIKVLRRVNVQKAKDIVGELRDINNRLDEAHGQGGLTNTIEELAAAVARVRQLENIDGDAIEKLRGAWMKALVNAM
jgi:hypothetical protein